MCLGLFQALLQEFRQWTILIWKRMKLMTWTTPGPMTRGRDLGHTLMQAPSVPSASAFGKRWRKRVGGDPERLASLAELKATVVKKPKCGV
jgi:hypothetical protein